MKDSQYSTKSDENASNKSNKNAQQKEKNIHAGHRKRIRKLYENNGLDGCSEHFVLELVLTYALARGDTNVLAHMLINEFGCISGVLEASIHDLCRVKGIGKISAILIHMMLDIFRYYQRYKASSTAAIRDFEGLKDYCRSLFIGVVREVTYVICMDNTGRIILPAKLGEGSVTANQINSRLIIEQVTKTKSNLIILSHNHPQGAASPSAQDLRTTKELIDILKPIGIELYDHIIIGRVGSYSMREMNVIDTIII